MDTCMITLWRRPFVVRVPISYLKIVEVPAGPLHFLSLGTSCQCTFS